jgi:hypothetical protein
LKREAVDGNAHRRGQSFTIWRHARNRADNFSGAIERNQHNKRRDFLARDLLPIVAPLDLRPLNRILT